MPRRLPEPFDLARLASLREAQSGVVSRRQLLAAGAVSADVRRWLAGGDLVAWAPGVYLDHRGRPTWLQRAWAAVLLCWPAVLVGESALRAEAGPGWRGRSDTAPILVGIDVARRLRLSHPDVVVRRISSLDERARWQSSPPRQRFEESALDSALAAPDLHAGIEALARAVRTRCTTPQRLIDALDRRARVPDRNFLMGVLADLQDGTSSILEHGYLSRVERPHGLPKATRQLREQTDSGLIYRDVVYEELGLDVELDGRLDHLDPSDRARDLARDLSSAVQGRAAVRLGWSQVFATPCRTAESIGRLLNSRGWTGRITPCGPGCEIRQTG